MLHWPSLKNRWSNRLFFSCLVTSSFCWVAPVRGQAVPPTKVWDTTVGGNKDDYLRAAVSTPDGGYLVAGESSSGIAASRTQASQGSYDYWMVKLDAAGKKQWDKRFGGSGADYFRALYPTSDGGYLLGGYSDSRFRGGDKTQDNGGDAFDFWALKTDAAGNKLWDITVGTPDTEELYGIAETEDGGYLLAGQSTGTYASDYDFWIQKLTQQGAPEWRRSYGGARHDELRAVQRTADGGFILAGHSDSPASGDKTSPSRGGKDYWVLKISALGQKEWDRTYGGPGDEQLSSLQLTADGGLLLGGTSRSGVGGDKSQASQGAEDIWLVKTDAAGVVQWEKRFGGAAQDNLRALQLVPGGGILLGGNSWSGISGDKTQATRGYGDFWLLLLNDQGVLQWERRYGGTMDDELQTLVRSTDGSLLLAGFSTSNTSGEKSADNSSTVNYWCLKLSPVRALATTTPVWAASITALPNPVQTTLTIRLPATNQAKEATMELVDMLGRTALRQPLLKLNSQYATESMIKVEALPRGVYILRISSQQQLLNAQRILID